MPYRSAISITADIEGSPLAASAAAAREKPSMASPGACTMKATASASDSLRIVCGVPPARGITWPAGTATRTTVSSTRPT